MSGVYNPDVIYIYLISTILLDSILIEINTTIRLAEQLLHYQPLV